MAGEDGRCAVRLPARLLMAGVVGKPADLIVRGCWGRGASMDTGSRGGVGSGGEAAQELVGRGWTPGGWCLAAGARKACWVGKQAARQ